MTDLTDPNLKSFVPVAADNHFPIQNLPYGVFQTSVSDEAHVGMAIGELVLDLAVLEQEGLIKVPGARSAAADSVDQLADNFRHAGTNFEQYPPVRYDTLQ